MSDHRTTIVRAASPQVGAPNDGTVLAAAVPSLSPAPASTVEQTTADAGQPGGGDRAAWLAARRHGIGASDVAAILSLSPWTSRYALWADKVGLIPDDEDRGTEAMEFGLRAERMLGEWLAERTGLEIGGEQMQCQHPDEPWMRCSLDGLAFEGPAGDIADAVAAVEFKTTSDTADAWEHEVPVHYACQATWTSIVTGLDVVIFGVLHLAFGRPQFRVYEFVPNDDDKQLVIAEARKFWFDHVVAQIAPETDGTDSTTDALRAAYPGDDELDAIEATDELLAAQARIVTAKATIKHLETAIAADENLIRAALGDHTAITHGEDAKGRPVLVATWKPGERTSIDTTALKADAPDIAAKYSKTTPTRSLLVKTPKAA